MSAIIAGKSCKGCGQSYHVSFGHPSWFPYDRNGRKRSLGNKDTRLYQKFIAIKSLGRCMKCSMVYLAEQLGEPVKPPAPKGPIKRVKI